jgi:hypothetical protein
MFLYKNYRQWVNDLEKLEFISLGNVITKGQAGHKEFDEVLINPIL